VPYGIRVNTVSPGSILVEGNGWDRYRLANPGYFEDYVRLGFPMGRLGTAEEVADVIVFIASPRAHCGSTAEIFRWMVWSSRTRRSTAGPIRLSHSEVLDYHRR
jgi:NAD(P)-dependent dehydrogenase (short-subunit alcohol dehydrogenase family)